MTVTRTYAGIVMLVAVRRFEGDRLRLVTFVTCMETKARLEAGVDITQTILLLRCQ